MKPARSPNAARVYAYGPPGVALAVARWANTSARSTDPPVDTSHPARLIAPYGASDAGSRNTPDPIMLPMTSAVAIQNPSEGVSVRSSREAAVSIAPHCTTRDEAPRQARGYELWQNRPVV